MGERVIDTWVTVWKRSNFPRIEEAHQFEPARVHIVYTNVDHTNQVTEACGRMAAVNSEILGRKLNKDSLLARLPFRLSPSKL